jgi:GlpG protein
MTSGRKVKTVATVNMESNEPPLGSSTGSARGAFSWKVGPATGVLIGLSIIVALWSDLGSDRAILAHLFITSPPEAPLAEILHGEIWRLLTPIFIHFGIMHLLFNMLWLKDLGTMIEDRLGSGVFLAQVVIMGVLANLGQFLFAGPSFGGMSGVVYGLLGFVWMKSRFDPSSGFQLHQQTVIMMIVWFFLCLTGALGPVANVAHATGLGTGILWGLISARTRRADRQASLEDAGHE